MVGWPSLILKPLGPSLNLTQEGKPRPSLRSSLALFLSLSLKQQGNCVRPGEGAKICRSVLLGTLHTMNYQQQVKKPHGGEGGGGVYRSCTLMSPLQTIYNTCCSCTASLLPGPPLLSNSVPPCCSLRQLEVRGLWHFLLWHIMKCNNTFKCCCCQICCCWAATSAGDTES